MPKEYIEREAIYKRLKNNKKWADSPSTMDYAAELVLTLPTADVIEVVRCKDCKFLLRAKMLCLNEGNRVFGMPKTTYSRCFCSYGAKMDKE